MKYLSLAILFLLLQFSCTPKLSLKYDTFSPQADYQIDEFPHFKNSLEWWYLTGHFTEVSTGNEYGVEFVFFNFNPKGKGDWMMVNMAITDVSNEAFYYDTKLRRIGKPLAQKDSLNLKMKDNKAHLTGFAGNFSLEADFDKKAKTGFKLHTVSSNPVLYHGEGSGYENYGDLAKAGYYSIYDLQTEGILWVNGKEVKVKGQMWYDRQWNCGDVMTVKNVGWDWMAIKIEPSQDHLMLYRVRLNSNTEFIYGGTYVPSDTSKEIIYLNNDDITMRNVTYWESTSGRNIYPTEIEINIERLNAKLNIDAVLPFQELGVNILPLLKMYYWEGKCEVSGTWNESKVSGNAYLEITNPQGRL